MADRNERTDRGNRADRANRSRRSERAEPATTPARPSRTRRSPRAGVEGAGGSMDGLLATKEIAVACGPGGVGKTTTAAAAAVMAAVRHGSKVLVLTIDPAKRLANALGLDGIGNAEHRVPDESFRVAGLKPRGQLWAAMLDTKESWDALIRRHAPDRQTRDEILANPLYQNISGRFVQSHDYIAMERLYEIHSESDYDLIVVDTPPTRNALDFLDAPQRMADFFSSRLLRWLIVPYRSRLVNVATKPFYTIADRILGTEFLGDISEFFILFQSMYDGFVERSEAVGRLLSDRRTTFIVVSTLEAVPLREAEFFAEQLTSRRLHLGAIVLNKVLPTYLRGPGGASVAESLKERAPELAASLATDLEAINPSLGDPDQIARVLNEVADSYLNFQVVALREMEEQATLSVVPDVLATVPFFDTDLYDLAGLFRLGEQIWE
jgi:anion-transporting  ArsA/GET3 family ATPase